MSDWSNFKNIKTGGGDILKPEEGKSYKIRIIGEPWVYSSEYKGNLSVRIALKIYNETDNQAQILMLSKTAFSDIYDLNDNEDWGNPEEYSITMKRTGEGTDTRYSFMPSAKKPLDEDKRAEAEAIVLDEVLSRLPSVQQAFPISEIDADQLVTKKKSKAAQITGGEDVQIEDMDSMPEDFLK